MDKRLSIEFDVVLCVVLWMTKDGDVVQCPSSTDIVCMDFAPLMAVAFQTS